MKRLSAVAAVAALGLSACGHPADEFRNGVPVSDNVRLNVPASSGAALSASDLGQRLDSLKGETSNFYQLTRGATNLVNGGAVAVLSLVKAITDNPPTTISQNQAVWGPGSDALSPTTWKLTVNRKAANVYSYTLEGKAKTAPDSAFVTLLSGTHNLDGGGSGTFLLDWTQAQTLPEHDDNVGTAAFTYSRDAAGEVAVATDFKQVRDHASGQRVDVQYRYHGKPDQSGAFEFGTLTNSTGGPALERLTVKSRWLASGAGRSDVKLAGGDLKENATFNECWDARFLSQYVRNSFDVSLAYGVEATDCGIAGADYSNL